MLALLRKTRLRLLNSKKLYNYIAYALGEIILVVIGILIALYLNHSSENYKAKMTSKAFLTEMVSDLAQDTLNLNRMLPAIENNLSYQDWLIGKESLNLRDKDSLKKAMSRINLNFLIIDKSFQNIQNSPNKLTGYDDLYNQISQYYLVTKARVEHGNRLYNDSEVLESKFENLIKKNILLETTEYNDYTGFGIKYVAQTNVRVGDFNQISQCFNDIETKNDLNSRYSKHNFINLTLSLCNIEAKQLINTINDRIKD